MAVELSIGSQTAKEKREVRDRLLGGQSRIVVGTHALIQEGVEFARLGLVIVDEQHRFGVLQRRGSVCEQGRPAARTGYDGHTNSQNADSYTLW